MQVYCDSEPAYDGFKCAAKICQRQHSWFSGADHKGGPRTQSRAKDMIQHDFLAAIYNNNVSLLYPRTKMNATVVLATHVANKACQLFVFQ